MSAVPARQRRKEARPQELQEAALALFVEKGFAATRAEEIAARAGVSKGTLYLYYPSKEELLKAVITQYLSEGIAAGAETARRFDGPTAALLRGVLVEWWQRVYDSPASGVFKLIVTEGRAFPEIAEFWVREVIEPGERTIGGMVQRGIDRREFRKVDVRSIVHSIVLPMVMLCVHKHSVGACTGHMLEVDPHRFIREHIELVLRGLLVGPTEIESAAPRKPRHKTAP